MPGDQVPDPPCKLVSSSACHPVGALESNNSSDRTLLKEFPMQAKRIEFVGSFKEPPDIMAAPVA